MIAHDAIAALHATYSLDRDPTADHACLSYAVAQSQRHGDAYRVRRLGELLPGFIVHQAASDKNYPETWSFYAADCNSRGGYPDCLEAIRHLEGCNAHQAHSRAWTQANDAFYTHRDRARRDAEIAAIDGVFKAAIEALGLGSAYFARGAQ